VTPATAVSPEQSQSVVDHSAKTDNRIEASHLRTRLGPHYALWHQAAASVGILVPRNALHLMPHGAWIGAYTDSLLGTQFSAQPCLGFSRPATLFCVGDGLLLTAAHVFPDNVDDDWLVVFDFRYEQFHADDSTLPARYEIRRAKVMAITLVLASLQGDHQGDIALVGCQPEFPESIMPPALSLASVQTVAPGDRIALLGYPRAQPLKAAVSLPESPTNDPRVVSIEGPWLHSTLATFRGNSGSPVLNLHGEVIAVHAIGNADGAAKNTVALPPGASLSQASALDGLASTLGTRNITLRHQNPISANLDRERL
jgi:hypothetical protein